VILSPVYHTEPEPSQQHARGDVNFHRIS